MTVDIEGLGKITADEATLNLIALFAYDSSDFNKSKGYYAISASYHRIAQEINRQLAGVGYFDNEPVSSFVGYDELIYEFDDYGNEYYVDNKGRRHYTREEG